VVEPGHEVKAGKPLIIIESMKMEFAQQAYCEGIVRNIPVKA
jgi:urea carboxylase